MKRKLSSDEEQVEKKVGRSEKEEEEGDDDVVEIQGPPKRDSAFQSDMELAMHMYLEEQFEYFKKLRSSSPSPSSSPPTTPFGSCPISIIDSKSSRTSSSTFPLSRPRSSSSISLVFGASSSLFSISSSLTSSSSLSSSSYTSCSLSSLYSSLSSSLCNAHDELEFPDAAMLFSVWNVEFFDGLLAGCKLEWSSRMTSSAGVCVYRRGSLPVIRLSEKLLKYRPVRNMKETLLHEMIHAFLFITQEHNREHHGPEFQKHMNRINNTTGFNITIFHSFHDEVRYYKKHAWKCNGRCQYHPPYFGIVRRASNRAPSPNDLWWTGHQANCGGTFIKMATEGSTSASWSTSSTSTDTRSTTRINSPTC